MSIPEKNQNKGSKALARDRRRSEAALDAAGGLTVRESAERLGVSKDTVVKDRKAVMKRFQSEAADTVAEHRAGQLIELAELKAQLVSPAIHPTDKVKLALAVIDREIQLLGTAAPTRSITARIDADVDPAQLVGYRRFVYETRGLDQLGLEEVYLFARGMERPETVEHLPPESSELWEEAGS